MNILLQPYPFSLNLRSGFRISFFIGIAVFFFLFIFKPFNLSAFHYQNKILLIAGYGFISFAGTLFSLIGFPYIFPKYFIEANWKVKDEIAITLWCFVFIGFLNLLYSNVLGFVDISFYGFISYQLITFSVGFFPVSLFVILKQNNLLKANLKEAAAIHYNIEEKRGEVENLNPQSSEIFYLSSENGRDQVQLTADQLLFISAAENYVEIHWLQNEIVQKTLLRNSISKIEEKLGTVNGFFRCHRTYIVNTRKITNVSGNAQGLKLELEKTEIKVPVARSQINAFRQMMESAKN